MSTVSLQQRYFQQLRPLSECDAEDGRILGHMLVDLVKNKPKDLAHAIRTFVNRTAMLRECSFCHIGAMLVRLLSADAQAGPDDDAAIVTSSPSTATERQASAIGSAIALSVHRSESQATALLQAVDLDPVLRTTKSQYLWFVPMLEVLLVPPEAATPRRPVIARRFSAIVSPQATFYAPSSANFDSVVRCIPCFHRTIISRPWCALQVSVQAPVSAAVGTFQGSEASAPPTFSANAPPQAVDGPGATQ
jgi:hypothetical protein